MDKLLTLFFMLLYLGSVCLLFTRRPQFFVYVTVFFITVNDLVFVNLNDILGSSLMVAKAWKEVFICGLLLQAMMNTRGRNPFSMSSRAARITIAIGVLSAIGIAVGMSRGGIVESIQQWRRYFVPILLATLLASPRLAQRVDIRTLTRVLLSIACVMAVYAIYEYLTFDGDFTRLWYYSFVAQAKEGIDTDAHLLQYQFMRGDQLRASGFFISAIEYSLFNALALTISIISLVRQRRFSAKVIFSAITLLLAAGEVVANVRIGWVACLLALFSAAQLHFFKTRSLPRLALAPILILLASFTLIIFNKGDLDASSVGRLAQYASVPSTFQIQGYGLGAIENNGATYKDSWYISVLMVFGVAAVGYLWLMFAPLSEALRNLSLNAGDTRHEARVKYTFYLGTIGFFLAQFYVFGFHYSTGLSHLYLLQIFMFTVATNLRSPRSTTVSFTPDTPRVAGELACP
ncbi:hypothetical protein [Paraburkholderia sp. Ac-20347]|uniref:hypothetical protein n=1 Tax=Paraburkholderia sp. Ac-20347 TaxID=2703892 RepID=UPI00197F7D3D|nr:hypothetical protein [Paraburkholderia sp. Ac-20347]MBN3810659.1 hypothetical protein [Paraburkholderia sp. Ac-20347]